MGRLLLFLAMLVKLAGNWQMQLFHINQIEESSKITINAHTTSGQLHQRSITTATTLLAVTARVSGWSRGLQQLLPAANCEMNLCQLFLDSGFISAPQECPQCLEPLTGRNILVENISAILFSQNHARHEEAELEKEKFQISTHLLFDIYLLAKFLVRLAGSLNLLSETEIKSS